MQENNKEISVKKLLENKDLDLKLVAGKKGLNKKINFSKVQKPGLALAGFAKYIKKGRVQIIGLSEIEFLRQFSKKKQKILFKKLLSADPACIILSHNIELPYYLSEIANSNNTAVLSSSYATSTLIEKITNYLSEELGTSIIMHGDLLNIYGIGTLIIGESGIGKSESALDLVVRGHQLIADDAVVIKKISETILIGKSHPDVKNFIEVRGIGIINICEMLGVSSTSNSSKIDLVILLEKWQTDKEYDRLGVDNHTYNILGVDIPFRTIPVAPGRNIAILIEIAVKNLLLKNKGIDSTLKLIDKLDEKIKKNKK